MGLSGYHCTRHRSQRDWKLIREKTNGNFEYLFLGYLNKIHDHLINYEDCCLSVFENDSVLKPVRVWTVRYSTLWGFPTAILGYFRPQLHCCSKLYPSVLYLYLYLNLSCCQCCCIYCWNDCCIGMCFQFIWRLIKNYDDVAADADSTATSTPIDRLRNWAIQLELGY